MSDSHDSPPTIGPVVPSVQQILDDLIADQRRRWQNGERVLVETYLGQHPGFGAAPDLVIDLIYHETLLRQELGESPDLAEYVQRFPHLAEDLAIQFEVDQGMCQDLHLGPPTLGASPSATSTARHTSPPGYEILEEIGRGGMGVVYKARQRGLNRLVALKMILVGHRAAPEQLARFRTEAEAVASLQHPSIVQIYEIGEFEGVPFVALEYVEGGSLAQRLLGVPQPPRPSAELVQRMARGIHHAHCRGIVHRDLKPANILLQEEGATDPSERLKGQEEEQESNRPRKLAWSGGSPPPATPSPPSAPAFLRSVTSTCSVVPLLPRITDFGLAKRLESNQGHTQSGDVVGTPSYMAPEQARGQSDAIGPASDVYALGAILYEMLTGRPPFLGTNVAETLLQVETRDPVPPGQLQPAVPRDLETICLKCLEKSPERRYPSAEAFAEDLDRFLGGQAILARPVGRLERACKWARRRPAAAALVGVSVLTGLVLLFGGWWVSLALRQAALRESQERQRAEDNFRHALEAVEHLLTEVADVDLVNVPQMEPVRKKLLRRAQHYYETFLADGSNTIRLRREAARAYRRLADILDLLGESAEAEAAFRQAIALLEEGAEEPADQQDLARAHHGLAVLLRKTNRFAEAERAVNEAIRLRRLLAEGDPENPEYQRDLAESAYHRGALLARVRGRHKEAEHAYREALARQRQLNQRHPSQVEYSRDLARTLSNLGILLQASRSPEAEQAIREAVITQEALRKRFPNVASYRWLLARYHVNLGTLQQARRPREADASYREALRLLESLAADFPTVPVYRQDLAAVHANRGLLFQAGKRWSEAEQAYTSALELRRGLATLPDDRARLAGTLVQRGFLLATLARPDQAEASYREAIGLLADLSARFPAVAAYRSAHGAALNNLAALLIHRADFGEGRQLVNLVVRNAWGSPLHTLEPVLAARSALREAGTCLEKAIGEQEAAVGAAPENLFYRQCLQHDHALLARLRQRHGGTK